MSKRFLAALILISVCNLGPARAEDAAAPFDGDLQRLAEILGSLHYLRGICGSNEGAKWRNQMQALIDAETPSGDRRTRMIAGFNRGYNGYQQTYRSLHPGRDRRDPPLCRGRRENLARPDRALRKLSRRRASDSVFKQPAFRTYRCLVASLLATKASSAPLHPPLEGEGRLAWSAAQCETG